MPSDKISLSKIKKIPVKMLKRMIDKARKHIKKDKIWEELCKEYDQDIDIIDVIPIYFGDIDVSATTNHGIITLNYSLLCDGDFLKDYSYIIHEATHYLQQTCGKKATESSDNDNYLNNENEQEGFQNQVEYIAKHQGDDKAEKYVDDLLDHHDVEEKEKPKMEKVFLDKIK